MNINQVISVLKDTVRQLRYKWDKNQEEFAKLLGLSQATVFKLENGNYDKLPKHETLIAISDALNMPYWQFIKMLEQSEGALEEQPKPMSKHKIIASIIQLDDFDDSFDVAHAALQRSQELRYQRFDPMRKSNNNHS